MIAQQPLPFVAGQYYRPDMVVRWSWIAVVGHNCSLKIIGEEITQAVYSLAIPHVYSDVANVVTISIGAAFVSCKDEIFSSELLQLADTALYESKEKGRNMLTLS